ncbi:MAG: flavodoxin [Bacteroidales bacterium]|nr:flavodoxin [Bacteroidales bacterium]
MKKVALIYWPEGGNVEAVADKIIEHYGSDTITKYSIANIRKEDLAESGYWIIGGSTVGSHVWEDADDSNKWNDLFKMLDKIDLGNKIVAFYGLGDQVLYPSHFLNGLGIFQEEFEKRKANIVGQWPIEGYDFYESEGLKGNHFFGLALDEDNQEELTDERITKWLEIIKKEFK